MAFKTRSTGGGNSSDRPNVDYAAMNKEIVETAKLEQPETLVGYLAGIYDVGVQPQPDAQYLFTGTAADEEAEIAKDSSVYFKDLKDYQDGGKVKRYKLKPVKPAQSVVFAVDFPDVIVDKGKYFGNSDPKPLRLLLGGEFTPSGGKTVAAKPQALTIRKNDKTNNKWSMPFNSTIYKMAVATKLINQGDPFLPERIDELLGKAMQFKAQVFLNDGKYFTEKCAFAASLSRGQKEPEIDKSLLHIIQFDEDNSEEALKQLRASVKNTIRNASDFEGSKIAAQIGEGFKKEETKKEEVKSEAKPFEPEEEQEVEVDDFDSDSLPF
jgi:hypothetical protein